MLLLSRLGIAYRWDCPGSLAQPTLAFPSLAVALSKYPRTQTWAVLGLALPTGALRFAFFYERRHLTNLSSPTTALSFFYGGVLGVFAAALLEPIFIHRLDFLTACEVGLFEESAKILGVLVIARTRRHDSELDGRILGAALQWSMLAHRCPPDT